MRPSSTPTATTSRALHPIDLDAATDDAWILVALHERVERRFDAYEAAEGGHAAQHRAVDAISRALATHAAVEDELLYPAARAYTARRDGDVDRQPQEDHLLDLVLPELRRRLGPAERELLGQRLLERVGQLEGRPRRRWWPCRSRSRFQAQGAGVQRHAAGSSGSPSGSAAACRGSRSTGAPPPAGSCPTEVSRCEEVGNDPAGYLRAADRAGPGSVAVGSRLPRRP